MAKPDRAQYAGNTKQPRHEKQEQFYEQGAGDGGVKLLPNTGPRLTDKMRLFVYTWFELGNATEAYKIVYKPSPDAKHSARRAADVMANPEVKKLIAQLRERALDRHDVTLESLTHNLFEDRKLAFENGDAKAAVAADMALAKIYGFLDQKHKGPKDGLEDHIRRARERVARVAGKETTKVLDSTPVTLDGHTGQVEEEDDGDYEED